MGAVDGAWDPNAENAVNLVRTARLKIRGWKRGRCLAAEKAVLGPGLLEMDWTMSGTDHTGTKAKFPEEATGKETTAPKPMKIQPWEPVAIVGSRKQLAEGAGVLYFDSY